MTQSFSNGQRRDSSSRKVKAGPQTIFLVGNGPSLKGLDLHTLSQHHTIGMNAAYRFWDRINWRPTFYACLDVVVGLSHKNAIADLIREGRVEKFLLRSNLIDTLNGGENPDRVVNFDALTVTEPVLKAPAITTGSHSALWAATMGYSEIVLLGIDGRYANMIAGAVRKAGIELEIEKQPDENPNYFFSDYQQAGDRYNIPNPRPDLHVEAWRQAAVNLKLENVSTYNANTSSAVRCFPFIDLNAYLLEGSEVLEPDEDPTSLPGSSQHLMQNHKQSRSKRFADFIKGHWLACLAPIVLLGCAAYALSAFFGFGLSLYALIIIAISTGALWTVLLFVRKTIIDHIKSIYERIDALEAYAKSHHGDKKQKD